MSKKIYKRHQGELFDDRQMSILFDELDASTTDDVPSQPEPSTPVKPINTDDHLCFVSFGSGSSGNCAYIGNEYSGVLIDAGIDVDKVFDALKFNGITPEMVKGIVLTHDHADHVRYAYKTVRKYKHMRIYCTPRLMSGMLRHHNISRRIKDYQESIFKEIPFHVAGMTITAFETSHDGSDNMGFCFERGKHKFVVTTDTGVITERAAHYMSDARHLMIECNYDLDMLNNGYYPEYLKNRVRGDKGHLDNVVAARWVSENCLGTVKNLFLCHLSNDNNTPETALHAMRSAIERKGLSVGDASNAVGERDKDIQLYALPRYDTSTWFILQ